MVGLCQAGHGKQPHGSLEKLLLPHYLSVNLSNAEQELEDHEK